MINPSEMANQFTLTPQQHQELLEVHKQHQGKLSIPRRPEWDSSTTPEQLVKAERESFLNWRRSLVVIEEELNLLMTPYERNIQVWRQLWRVVERSDLVVQIVDARNPLLFMCTDVATYVLENDDRKKNLLLVNKADMLSETQRLAWANYFIENGIQYRFFSAALAKKLQDEDKARASEMEEQVSSAAQRVADHLGIHDDDESDSWEDISHEQSDDLITQEISDDESSNIACSSDKEKVKILNVDELLELFMKECPQPLREQGIYFS